MISAAVTMHEQMIRPTDDAPPGVMLDWMPWNHVAGGSHNVGIAIYNGGTFYIDDGQPTPARFSATLRNLAEVATLAHDQGEVNLFWHA